MEEKKYIIYKNDLKNRKNSNIDITKINWEGNDIRNIININHDTLEYRLNENKLNDMIDFTNLELTNIPKQINLNVYFINLKHLFISNNNLSKSIDFINFINLETLDIDNNNIESINFPDKLKELSICNNKLKSLNCKNLIRLKCSNNILTNIILSKNLEIIEINNNYIQNLNLINLNKLQRLIIFSNPLTNISLPNNISYLDISDTQIIFLNEMENLINLVANNCVNLKNLPKLNNMEFLEIIGTPIEKLIFYEKYKLIILQINLTKNISKKYKESNASIKIRNNILLTISNNIDFCD